MDRGQNKTSCGFACGIVSGFGQSALFNAYDRAMYHSIVNSRPFLDPQNWRGNPFTGVSPSFLQRSFSAGLYFPLEDIFKRHVSSSYAVDGVLIGLIGGAFTTPFNAIKYAMWTGKSDVSVSTTAIALLREGGVTRLMRGVTPTLYRDMTFGLTYSLLRHQGDEGFMINAQAAFIATCFSSPFNYARMRIYGGLHAQSTYRILFDWRSDVVKRSGLFRRIQFVIRSLNMGWGALRVGLGMGIGSQIYNTCAHRFCNFS